MTHTLSATAPAPIPSPTFVPRAAAPAEVLRRLGLLLDWSCQCEWQRSHRPRGLTPQLQEQQSIQSQQSEPRVPPAAPTMASTPASSLGAGDAAMVGREIGRTTKSWVPTSSLIQGHHQRLLPQIRKRLCTWTSRRLQCIPIHGTTGRRDDGTTGRRDDGATGLQAPTCCLSNQLSKLLWHSIGHCAYIFLYF